MFARYGAGAETGGHAWFYDITGPGQRLHMNDLAASIGLVELQRLPEMNSRRAELVARYQR